jgi:DNA-binding LytR/AlgR family response regulator
MEAFEYECIVDLVKPITEDRFQKAIQKQSFKINANSKQTTAVGEDNKNEFYVNIDRRLIKIEMALVNIVQPKETIFISKQRVKLYCSYYTKKNRR